MGTPARTTVGRRATLGFAAAAAAAALGRSETAGAAADDPLRLVAAARGFRYGAEAVSSEIERDRRYRALFARECAVLVPGLEAKWIAVEPDPGRFDFGPLDRMVAFAASADMALRLHTLVWALAEPPWLQQALRDGDKRDARALLARHVRTVAGRYRGRVLAWDVANEMSDPLWHRGPEGLTLSPWRTALGPEIVPLAFRLTREADPHAKLFLNEDGLEWRGARFDAKRSTYLRLIEGWKRDGVPIDGFGLQTHLGFADRVDDLAYRRFLAELAGFGLEIHLTELDVRDRDAPADPARRDRAAAALVRDVLGIALDEPAVSTVVTWGLSDRYTYVDTDPQFRRADLLPGRPLPFDADLRPKPMRDALAAAFRDAPPRRFAAATARRISAL